MAEDSSKDSDPVILSAPALGRKWKIRAGLLILALLVAGGVIIAPKLQKKKASLETGQKNVNLQSTQSAAPRVVCKRFTSLKEALANVEIACVLDLSNQNLTSVPADITKLIKLNELSLKGNKLTALPPALLQLNNLVSLDLSDNQITDLPKGIS
ncbi:MAG: small GTP-binding protein, partial [Microgenomates group bacterium Gr01-1014_80]